jgi:hypothetical protein
MISYRATLVRSNGPEQIQHFSRQTDAILWLVDELAGHGYSVYGEIRVGDSIVVAAGKAPGGELMVFLPITRPEIVRDRDKLAEKLWPRATTWMRSPLTRPETVPLAFRVVSLHEPVIARPSDSTSPARLKL